MIVSIAIVIIVTSILITNIIPIIITIIINAIIIIIFPAGHEQLQSCFPKKSDNRKFQKMGLQSQYQSDELCFGKGLSTNA